MTTRSTSHTPWIMYAIALLGALLLIRYAFKPSAKELRAADPGTEPPPLEIPAD